MDLIVPIALERVAADVDRGELFLADGAALGIFTLIEPGMYLQALRRPCRTDELHDDFMRFQRDALPVAGDVAPGLERAVISGRLWAVGRGWRVAVAGLLRRVARLGTPRKVRSGQGLTEGDCHVSDAAGSALASMSAYHAECWAAAVPWRHGRDARRDSGKGVERMPPEEADFPCKRA